MNLDNTTQKNGEAPLGLDEIRATDDPKVFSNVIPLRRDKHGNPVPRRHIFLRPLVTLDPRALVETGEAFLRSPEAGSRHLPWLKSRNAVAADQNVQRTKQAIEQKIASDNVRVQQEIDQLVPVLESWKTRETDAMASAAAALEGLPIAFAPDAPVLDFGTSEPLTLAEIAGHQGLPFPEPAGWWERKGYKILSAIGGGIVFGLSFGLLTEKLQLINLRREWPMIMLFALVGITLMTVIEGIFPALGKSLGCALYRRGVKSPRTNSVVFFLNVVFLLGLALTIVLIESRVEQLGIFKGIAASTSIHGIHVSQTDLFWVSLMLVVPVVSCYTILGLAEGHRLANLVHLKGLLAQSRSEIRVSQTFAKAASLHQHMRRAIGERQRLESELENLKQSLRYELTVEEQERLEDMEMDATAHSWATEDLMLSLARGNAAPRPESSGRKKRASSMLRAFLRRLLRGRF